MADPTTATPGATPASSPVAPGSGPARPGQSVAGLSPEELQRARWREKKARQKARKLGVPYVPGPDAQLVAANRAPVGRPPGPAAHRALPGAVVAPGVPGPVAVPWQADTLKPLFEALIPALEKADVASLVSKAEKLDATLAKEVAKDAAWNPAAKTVAETAGPQCAAKWLNAAGIDANYAPEVALGLAAVTIFTGRMMLASKLDKLVREKKEQDDRLRSAARVDAGDGQKRDGQNDVRPSPPGSQN